MLVRLLSRLALTAVLAVPAAGQAAATAKAVCRDGAAYRVVSRPRADSVGDDIFARALAAVGTPPACRYDPGPSDYVVTGPDDASSVWRLVGSDLLLDVGTSPDRVLDIVDLAKQRRVLSTPYLDKDSKTPPVVTADAIVFWRVTDRVPTQKACPTLARNKAQGLGTAVTEKVRFSFSDASLTVLGPTSCTTTQ